MGNQKMIVKKERFWVLLLFGLSTMINACGWISIAPVFSLVEDVSNRFVEFLLTGCTFTALRCVYSGRELHVILVYGALPTNELPLRLCDR